ncbi:MAG: hypothetical protein WCI73_12165 [Phycisphaerae bacterium]
MRFVVLRHQPGEASKGEGVHWDFILETAPGAERLPTWRLAAWQGLEVGEFVAEAVRLPDHRRAYLDYEGEISGERGRVKQAISGTAVIIFQTPERLELLLRGNGQELRAIGIAENSEYWRWSFLRPERATP